MLDSMEAAVSGTLRFAEAMHRDPIRFLQIDRPSSSVFSSAALALAPNLAFAFRE